jgi:hypothetical protein
MIYSFLCFEIIIVVVGAVVVFNLKYLFLRYFYFYIFLSFYFLFFFSGEEKISSRPISPNHVDEIIKVMKFVAIVCEIPPLTRI